MSTDWRAEEERIIQNAKKRDRRETIMAVLILGPLGIGLLAFLCLIQPYMEAKTYTRLTGKQVTMWDAMWVDLRVQEEPK